MPEEQDPFLHFFGEEIPRPGLTRIKKYLSALNNPQLAYKSVVIAGTNGKGSTACYSARILAKMGLKVGLFTSPHFVSVRERIKILNPEEELISADDLACIVERIRKLRNEINTPLTYFEAVTLSAFQYFKEKKVNIAVLEVGLGGRLDATNVADKIVTVVTEVSLDHTHVLGSTISEIAREKAGIVVPNIPLVTGAKGKALEVIRDICRKRKSPVFVYRRDFSFTKNGDTLKITFGGKAFKRELTAPFPEFFQKNFVIGAYAGYLALGEPDASRFQDVISSVELHVPGRFHVIKKHPLWVVDSAHNAGAMKALVKSLKEFGFQPHVIVFSRLRDKSPAMLNALSKLSDTLFAVQITSSPRAEKVDKIAREAWGKGFRDVQKFRSVEEIPWKRLEEMRKRVLITGSSYLTGEIFRLFHIKPVI